MNTFNPLTLALEDCFETPLGDLPDTLRQRVETDFFPMPWDTLSAAQRREMALQHIRDLMDLKPEHVETIQHQAREDIAATSKASTILRKLGDYDRALEALMPETREFWQSSVDKEEYTTDAAGLEAFIDEHVIPVLYQQEKSARHHYAIVNQAIGEGFHAYKLEQISRYETHLDRKFERTLAMLVKLKELRGNAGV